MACGGHLVIQNRKVLNGAYDSGPRLALMLNPLRMGIPLGVRAARPGVFALSFSLSSIALPVGVGMATAAAASAVVSAATASSRLGLIVSVVFAPLELFVCCYRPCASTRYCGS